MKRALLLAAGLFLLVLVVLAIVADVRSLRGAWLGFPVQTLLPACALVLGNYALRTVRFRVLLQALGVRLPWPEAALVFIGGFVFSVTPGKMGEIAKGWLLHQRRAVPVTDTATVVVAERFTDVVGLLLLAAVGVAQHGAHVKLFVGVLGLCVAFLLGALQPRLVPAVVSRLQLHWQGPGMGRLFAAVLRMHAVLAILCTPQRLALGVGLAAAAWFLECIAFRLLLDGAGASGGLGGAVVVYAMATLFGAVSMLPGGVGTTEAVMVGLLLQPGLAFGLDLPHATLATLLIRFSTLWFGVLCGALALVALRRLPVR